MIQDVEFVSDPGERSAKALLRGAQALYGLARYAECEDMLRILEDKHGRSDIGNREMERVKMRLDEQRTGNYQFKKLYSMAKLRPPLIDCATYNAPVEIRQSPGRGKGLFTTKAVKTGELLLCEKALGYCFAVPEDEMKNESSSPVCQMSVLIDIVSNRITVGTHADLIGLISNKLIQNPSMIPAFTDLHHGEYKTVPISSIDGAPVLDRYGI